MLRYWQEGYDDVYATRRSRGKESWLRRRLSLSYYSLLQRTTHIPVLQNAGDFRLLDRICIDALRSMREVQRYTKGLFTWIGFRKKEITFDRADRAAGQTHWNFWKLLALAIEGITSYTTIPLRISTVVGFVTSIGAFIATIYFLLKTWLLGLGIMGEYIGRIFNETKGRPAYFVQQTSYDSNHRRRRTENENNSQRN